MRGKVCMNAKKDRYAGITPAYAGKRADFDWLMKDGKDHPRLCGEKPRSCKTSVSRPGSPPPMRGKDAFSSPSTSKVRITPAYAGKSPLTLPLGECG